MLGLDVCEFGSQLLELMWLTVCYKDIMADKDPEIYPVEENALVDTNYKAPAQKTLKEIQEMDCNDESLNKYKQALLGFSPKNVDPSLPNVQVTRLTLICTAAPEPIFMDLTGDLAALKKKTFVLKEGVEYRLKINFKVNREIVSGLKYIHYTCKGRLQGDKDTYMVGSYGPREEEYEFISPVEEAPRGIMVRGMYTMKSYFTDDDKSDHLHWEWKLNIKKDWND
ncbi:rho GDP-dissociation inhibitor 3 isoform X1 [Hypanus sabinus]|uniref:rho GDP-dissociation inhibitor 3 isoform X1 n=1 Tax=Hypanus sabinus TaxID=79690 RepID=UPI0028C3D101|nr:rho GDP-dissociation inhibitor 3 isoform X1 [Hypanus sabinus]